MKTVKLGSYRFYKSRLASATRCSNISLWRWLWTPLEQPCMSSHERLCPLTKAFDWIQAGSLGLLGPVSGVCLPVTGKLSCLSCYQFLWWAHNKIQKKDDTYRSREFISLASLREGTATHSSILAWKIPWTEEPCGLQSTGSQRVRRDCQAPLSMEFSRQRYQSELPFPSPGDLPDPGIEARSPVFAGRWCTVWAAG